MSGLGRSCGVANDESTLEDHDREVIARCLRAAVDGPFFPDAEFTTLFGLDRHAVAAVLRAWPGEPESVPDGWESASEARRIAVSNALTNLLGYPHGFGGDAFAQEVGASEEEVDQALRKWRAGRA